MMMRFVMIHYLLAFKIMETESKWYNLCVVVVALGG
jgi:hypothetical protein